MLTSVEYNSTKRPLAKAYAFEMSSVQVNDTDLRMIIVPTLLPDGSGVDFYKHPRHRRTRSRHNCELLCGRFRSSASMKGSGRGERTRAVCLPCARRAPRIRSPQAPWSPSLRPPQRLHHQQRVGEDDTYYGGNIKIGAIIRLVDRPW